NRDASSHEAYPLASAVPAGSNAAAATQAKPILTASNAAPSLPGSALADAAPVSNSRPAAVNTAATGSLAVSSPIAAEIYIGEKYLGSTPATLQLPAGSQTLEYRHGDLRSVMTHVVKANEVTTALVSFNVMVQLNARPWANVTVEGSPRVPL